MLRRVTCALLAVLFVAGCTGSSGGRPDRGGTSTPRSDIPSPGTYSPKPNIVFVLTDDLSLSLLPFMPHALALQQTGTTFSNYLVTDSLCCPSRSSILSGRMPHNTGVFTNDPPDGGFERFYKAGEEKQTFAVALENAGYRTALMGKYLNGYQVGPNTNGYPPTYIPPGWTDWAGVEKGYGEFNYDMNVNGKVVHYGKDEKDYLTNVISQRGSDFITSAAKDRKPFLLELASFAPHAPFTPDPVDSHLFPGLTAPRGPSYDKVPTDPPKWLAQSWRRIPFSQKIVDHLDRAYRLRVQSVQAIDRMIGNIQRTLEETGQLDNTVFVFSSDNGYHIGEHGLTTGKLTAFDTDIHVPLIFSGKGVARGIVRKEIVQNIDLAPTFEQLAGVTPSPIIDGHSLVPLLSGQNVPWRTVALIEHHGPVTAKGDPDAQDPLAGDPPTYEAIRTADYTYVRYVTGDREYYDLRKDPFELHNLGRTLKPVEIQSLDAIMNQLSVCKGEAQCWPAARVT